MTKGNATHWILVDEVDGPIRPIKLWDTLLDATREAWSMNCIPDVVAVNVERLPGGKVRFSPAQS